nr:hypothetical protein [Nanoarchaeota archaeon]
MVLKIDDPEFIALIEKGIHLDRLEKRLRPELGLGDYDDEEREHDGYSNFSDDGFLGKKENLLEIIHADWQTVEKYGTSHEEIAKALEKAIKKKRVPNKRYKSIFGAVTLGFQCCPWECEEKYALGNMMAFIHHKSLSDGKIHKLLRYHVVDKQPRNPATWEKFAILTELHPHLIRAHYFFEGKESPYRTDPEFLIKALNLSD